MKEPVPPGDDRSSPPTNLPAITSNKLPTVVQQFPDNLPEEFALVLGQNGRAYAVMQEMGNPYALAVGSKNLNNLIRANAKKYSLNLRQNDIRDINFYLQAHAEMAGKCSDVWYRVAPVKGGIEIDVGDLNHTRVRITAGKVEVIKAGSTNLFFRTPMMLPMALPVEMVA